MDFGHHMNIAPGATEQLDIGSMKLFQFRLYVWGGPGTEMSKGTVRAWLGARHGASVAISAVTAGSHELVSGVVESTFAEACQHAITNHLAAEIIQSHVLEECITHYVEDQISGGLKNVVDRSLRPKEWGVCTKYFWAALDDNFCYVYGGPKISNGKIWQGDELYMAEYDNGYDPVEALNELARIAGSNGRGGSSLSPKTGGILLAGSVLLMGASLPVSAVAGGAWYLWKKNKK